MWRRSRQRPQEVDRVTETGNNEEGFRSEGCGHKLSLHTLEFQSCSAEPGKRNFLLFSAMKCIIICDVHCRKLSQMIRWVNTWCSPDIFLCPANKSLPVLQTVLVMELCTGDVWQSYIYDIMQYSEPEFDWHWFSGSSLYCFPCSDKTRPLSPPAPV